MELTQGMPFEVAGIKAMIFGGPFKKYVPGTRRLVGVKMAEEISHPHDISIPTEDFSVPDQESMVQGMSKAILAMHEGNDIYAGCMGGIGRTGLFMGCMAKLMDDYAVANGEVGQIYLHDPVAFVRSTYKGHAIETQEQQSFVRTIPTEDLIALVDALTKPKVQIVEVERVVEKEVERVVVLSPLQWAMRLWGVK